MKKYLIIILISITIASCKKDDVVITHDRVGISKVTYYVNITLTGASSISVVQNTAFTDPGVKGDAGGVDVPVTTTGTVDVSTPGSYTLSYSATNSDGYSSVATRTVYVIPSAEVPGVDISGDYATTGGTPDATITKVAPGVYTTTNCWGNGSLAIIPAYFFCTDGSTVSIPFQVAGPYGRIMTTSDGTYSPTGLITWTIIREDFAPPLTLTKTWQKQ